MPNNEIIAGLLKNDGNIKKQLFDTYYGKFAAIALRYSKNQEQGTEVFNAAFNKSLQSLQKQKNSANLKIDEFLEGEFIRETVEHIKNIRSEYYVASTVFANSKNSKNYDLFEYRELVDFNSINNEVLIKALQQLVPSQRLVFNLHVIENYTLEDTTLLLEASEQTVKSNLEKARYNLQKNIEKILKVSQYEQSL